MLLINQLKEYKVVNGSIGIVKGIIFEHRDGSRYIPYDLPNCLIIEFKENGFAEGTKWWTNWDKKNRSN